MSSSIPRSIRRGAAATAVALTVLLAGASSAHAHVEANAADITDDGMATVELSFTHGCSGQPTTGLKVAIPDQVSDVVPQPKDGWTTAVAADQFSWTGGSIPDNQAATFTVTMRVWGNAGDTIWLKTIQSCPTSDEAWIEIQQPGQPEPEFVAPSFTLPRTIAAPSTTVATTAAPTTSTTVPRSTTTTAVPSAVTQEGSPQNNVGLLVGGIAVGVIVVGALILYFRHRPPRPPKGNPTEGSP